MFLIDGNCNRGVDIHQEANDIDFSRRLHRIEFVWDRHSMKFLKILHLSDTHFRKKQGRVYLAYMKEFMDETFDLIFHTGDIIDYSNKDIEKYHRDFLSMLNSRYGKFYVHGNHENYDDKKELQDIMDDCGFENLTNSFKKIKLEKSFVMLFGLDDSLFGKPDASVFEKYVDEKNFNIMILHNLDAFEKRFYDKFNLVLSGHLHSGEINLGFFDGIDYMIKYNKHYFNLNQHKKGIKFLSEKCISFIHPGMHTHVKRKYGLFRVFTDKEGPVILKLQY